MTRGSRRRPPAAELLAAEHGTLYKEAETRVALVYPSPYHVAMSSLGYQQIYRSLHELPQMAADRAMFDDSEGGIRIFFGYGKTIGILGITRVYTHKSAGSHNTVKG